MWLFITIYKPTPDAKTIPTLQKITIYLLYMITAKIQRINITIYQSSSVYLKRHGFKLKAQLNLTISLNVNNM